MQYAQCGFAVFLVDDEEVMRSASLVTDVPFVDVSSPAGSHRLRVELRDDSDVVAVNDVEEPLAREVSVLTVDAGDACPK